MSMTNFMPKPIRVYAFDVDHTLEVSHGPIKFQDIIELKSRGHIVGLCGNWALVTRNIPYWHVLFSFLGPMAMTKELFLGQIKLWVPGDEYIMVGNDNTDPKWPDERMISIDAKAAKDAGWMFICEDDFASGTR
jgi:hypothetical protein